MRKRKILNEPREMLETGGNAMKALVLWQKQDFEKKRKPGMCRVLIGHC